MTAGGLGITLVCRHMKGTLGVILKYHVTGSLKDFASRKLLEKVTEVLDSKSDEITDHSCGFQGGVFSF
jgi:hypothetical protein